MVRSTLQVMGRSTLHVMVPVGPPNAQEKTTENPVCSPLSARAALENTETFYEFGTPFNSRVITTAAASPSTASVCQSLAPLNGAPMSADLQRQVEVKAIKMTTAIYMLVALAAFARPDVVLGQTRYQGDVAELRGSAAHSCPIANVKLFWRAANAEAVASECASYLESLHWHIDQVEPAQVRTTMMAMQELFRVGSPAHASCCALAQVNLKDVESVHKAFEDAITDVRSAKDFRFRDGEDIIQGSFLLALNNTDTLPKMANIIDNHVEDLIRDALLDLLKKSSAEGPRFLSARWQEAAAILKSNWAATAKDTGRELLLVEDRYKAIEQLEKWLDRLVSSRNRDEQLNLICYLIQGVIDYHLTPTPSKAHIYGQWGSAFTTIWIQRFLTPLNDILKSAFVKIDMQQKTTAQAIKTAITPFWNDTLFKALDLFLKGPASMWLRELQLARAVNPENLLKAFSFASSREPEHLALALTAKAAKCLPGHIYEGEIPPALKVRLEKAARHFLQHSFFGKAVSTYANQLPASITGLLDASNAPAPRNGVWEFDDASLNQTFADLQGQCFEDDCTSFKAWQSEATNEFLTWLKVQSSSAAASQADRELAALYVSRFNICLSIQQINTSIHSMGAEYLAVLEQAGFFNKANSGWLMLVETCGDLTLPLMVNNPDTDGICRTLNWLLAPAKTANNAPLSPHLQSLRLQLVSLACQSTTAPALPRPANRIHPALAATTPDRPRTPPTPESPTRDDTSPGNLTLPLSPGDCDFEDMLLSPPGSPRASSTTTLARSPVSSHGYEQSYWSMVAAEDEDPELVAIWEATQSGLAFEYPTTYKGVKHTRTQLSRRYFPTILGIIWCQSIHDLRGVAGPLSSCFLHRMFMATALATTILGTHNTLVLPTNSRAGPKALQEGTMVNFLSLPPFTQAILSSIDPHGHLAGITRTPRSLQPSPLSQALASIIHPIARLSATTPAHIEGIVVIHP